ncbi:MAG: pimeloyl-ACP methyl esterase BioG family protein, partial [Bacteroidales bacterium]
FLRLDTGQNDLLICYDYTVPDFDFSLLDDYEQIYLTAWSMGVWAAARLFESHRLTISYATAINGTHTPISDLTGISLSIFQGTLNSLSDKNLERFNRRMCGSKEMLDLFYQNQPQRPVESLKSELKAIGEACMDQTPSFLWDKIIIGERDLIFTYKNQLEAWKNTNNQVILDEAHFFDFKQITI